MSRRNRTKKKRRSVDVRSRWKRRQDDRSQPITLVCPHKLVVMRALYRAQTCPRCGRHGYDDQHDGLDLHHVFPKRHFGPNGFSLYLCYRCHHLVIEAAIAELERPVAGGRLSSWAYCHIVTLALQFPQATSSELVEHFVRTTT